MDQIPITPLLGRLTREEKCIEVIGAVAQTLRDESGLRLCQLLVDPSDLLRKMACALARLLLVQEAYDLIELRESMQQEAADAYLQVNAGLLLLDVCELLALTPSQTQQALSLAEWCDIQQLLDAVSCPVNEEVVLMDP